VDNVTSLFLTNPVLIFHYLGLW